MIRFYACLLLLGVVLVGGPMLIAGLSEPPDEGWMALGVVMALSILLVAVVCEPRKKRAEPHA